MCGINTAPAGLGLGVHRSSTVIVLSQENMLRLVWWNSLKWELANSWYTNKTMHITILLLLNFAIFIFNKNSGEKLEVKNSGSEMSNESDEPTTRRILSDAFLSDKTIAKLSDVLRIHPTKIWKLKDRLKSGQDLGINESKFSEFIDYPQSERLEEKLRNVLKGDDVHLTVIGGSNSGGAGVQEDEQEGAQGIFPLVVTDWWAKAITPLTGSELKLNLVSIGGTGSDFQQYCHHAFLENQLDLVLLESSVNDLNHIQQSPKVNRSLALEQLTRQLLLYPSQPALLYVNLYDGTKHCKNLDDYGQRALSHTYKITTVRWRDLVCPLIVGNVRNPSAGLNVLCKDGHHVNLLGHAQVSLMLINIIRDVLLNVIRKGLAVRSSIAENPLPKPVFINTTNKIISNPLCWTTITPNYKKPIKHNLNVKVVKNTAFQYWPLIRMGYPCDSPRVCRTDAYSGWVGTIVGATLVISFTVPSVASGDVVNTRSVVFATRTCAYCGNAIVWLDNDFEDRVIIKAKIDWAQTSVNIIALHVNPGLHTLTISVLEPGNVTLAGVMLGPSDGPY